MNISYYRMIPRPLQPVERAAFFGECTFAGHIYQNVPFNGVKVVVNNWANCTFDSEDRLTFL